MYNLIPVRCRVIGRTDVLIRRKLKFNRKAFSAGATTEVPSSSDTICHDSDETHGVANNVEQHDIAIIGGGMVGMALACSLASRPMTKHLDVAIVDRNPSFGEIQCIKDDRPPDPRVSAVTPATISLFRDIGAWKYVEDHRHAYFDKMQVWDYTGLGYTTYNARDAGKDVLGCIVENVVLQNSLLKCMQEKGVNMSLHRAGLTNLRFSSRSFTNNTTTRQSKICRNLANVQLSDGKTLYAKLVVGADGGKSRVRELADIKTLGWSYDQTAVICTVEHSAATTCTWQRFLPNGPVALLPLGDKFSQIVWYMSPKQASENTALADEDFVKAVNHSFDQGYGPHPASTPGIFSWLTTSTNDAFEVPLEVVKVVSKRLAFPLSLMHAGNYVIDRVVLIGDAAHTIHPLAGQGVNLGFGDVSSLAGVIADSVATGLDIGEFSMLRKFENERKVANIWMMLALDGFHKAFSIDFGPLNMFRAAAFHGVHHISPLKKRIILYASGEQRWPIFV